MAKLFNNGSNIYKEKIGVLAWSHAILVEHADIIYLKYIIIFKWQAISKWQVNSGLI